MTDLQVLLVGIAAMATLWGYLQLCDRVRA